MCNEDESVSYTFIKLTFAKLHVCSKGNKQLETVRKDWRVGRVLVMYDLSGIQDFIFAQIG